MSIIQYNNTLACRKALTRISVFKACELDRPGVVTLLQDMPDAKLKLEAFDSACASNLCVVARLGVCSLGLPTSVFNSATATGDLNSCP